MQQYLHDRRASGVRRVSVERLVDVCGSSDPASAFQGRSVDVSGRGMQIRSVYLPELRAPIVVRFQERGADVIAEGEVAWRKVRAHGGDFGVRFTALDSGSVQTLKALCGVEPTLLEQLEQGAPASEASAPVESDHDTEPLPPTAIGVKLHIGGLATPMNAQVRGHGRQSVEVGSPLEFLRVGRSLEVEDVVRGGRRGARIDAVDVVVDETTRIPELLVSLRYAEPSESPVPVAVRPKSLESRGARTPAAPRSSVAVRSAERAPAEVDAAEEEGQGAGAESDAARAPESRPARAAGEAGEAGAAAQESARPASEPTEPEADPEDALRERLDGMIGGMTEAARVASAQVARLGGAASRSTGWLVARARRLLERSQRAPVQRRRTAAAPRSLRQAPIRQSPSLPSQRRAEPARRRPTRGTLIGCALALTTIGLLLAARRPPLQVQAPAAARAERISAPSAAVQPGAAASGPARVSDHAAPPAEPELRRAEAPGSSRSRAGSLPEDDSGEATAESSRSSASKGEAQLSGSDEFGQGRLTLPVVYRLRLDQAGGALRGERTPTGFEVTIEGRRVVDSVASISERDERIAKVSLHNVALHNGSPGTRISFRFRHTIPGYKVRLRKDYVEFLISSS